MVTVLNHTGRDMSGIMKKLNCILTLKNGYRHKTEAKTEKVENNWHETITMA